VIEPKFDLRNWFSEGLAAVMVGNKWGYIINQVTLSGHRQNRELSNVNPLNKEKFLNLSPLFPLSSWLSFSRKRGIIFDKRAFLSKNFFLN